VRYSLRHSARVRTLSSGSRVLDVVGIVFISQFDTDGRNIS
jgi:hypothetical protein